MPQSRPVDERPSAVPAGRRPGPRPRPTPYPRAGAEGAPGPAADSAPEAEAEEDDGALAEELAALEEDLPGDRVDVWALVRQAQDGDAEAFGRLYDHYVTLVYRYVLHRVGDRAQAEDFTSETFVRALRRIDSLSFQGRDVGSGSSPSRATSSATT
ncbi:Sigma-70 region 2 [Geodermatophilus amargosae]|uniref:Sigma-70 region 2 n=1 Tax=Geodermatophilus amargosae TaxID=1296565 RepID=A0A1I6Y7R7_9ACTN|nr:sigma factor [Geodermatophilus amargosae]SFT46559.1 Sigma-70 region 2 [Geodermatophilus amargosae]